MHKMSINYLYEKAFKGGFLSLEEGLILYQDAPLQDLMWLANTIRQKINPGNKVGWIIDRNVNITNVCIARCRFCNFHCIPKSEKAYVTTLEEYREKIISMFTLGGDQLLLQGGLHPDLDVDDYARLFKSLKREFPALKLHALGPPEIHHLASISKTDYRTVLQTLIDSGLDSLPGAGAEILVDRVRKQISPGKCTAEEWLQVMREAHKLGLPTSATMMFGHAETQEERLEHLVKIRQVQAEKPDGSIGFISFIPWPFQDEGTILSEKYQIKNTITGADYIRLIAVSRIMLPNIQHIQASWLTVGKSVGQLCLHAGANDFGSIMLEENVVSSAGAKHNFDAKGIQQAICEAGFIPYRRNQRFEACS